MDETIGIATPPQEIKPSKSTGKVVAKAAGLMIVTIMLSRLLGFVRESLLIYYFGRAGLTDIYKLSFTIPDMLYFLIAGGALSSAFIPVFTKYLTEGKDEDAWKVFSVVACTALSVASVFIIFGWIYAEPLSRLIAPGLSDRPEAIKQLAYLTRIILPAQAFFFLGGLMMGTLYSRNKFLAPAFGPLIYNIAIIAGGIATAHFHAKELHYLASPEVREALRIYCDHKSTAAQIAAVSQTVDIGHVLQMGTRAVAGYSWGALIGAFIGNFCIQLFAMRKVGMRFKPSFEVSHEGVKRVFALMLPVILGLSLPQVDVLINRWFGNLLAVGAVTALDNANRLMQLPYGVFGQAFGTAIFPTLSALAAKRLWDDYRSQLSQGIRGIVFLTLPASVLMMVLAVPIIRFVFEHGRMVNAEDTRITAFALVLYCAGVFVWSMQAVIARGFYALHDTITVVATGTVMTVLFIGMNFGFLHTPWARSPLSPGGLALTTTIAASLHTTVLLWILRKRLNGIDGRRILTSVGKMMIASAVMAAVVGAGYIGLERWGLFAAMIHGHEAKKALATGIELLVLCGIGAVVYGWAAHMLKLPELDYAMSMFRSRFRKKSANAG
ncbi:MAG TPA: murein biosynthesis integral membrane protein MurJ [Armatimonadota bacterium]